VLDWALIVAAVAIVISVSSLICNWRHSESLFRRTEYPAVAWYLPKVSKEGNNTFITTSIRNYGSKDITSIFIGAFLCRGFKVKAWCKSNQINEIPVGEELTFQITKELEKDIAERFGELVFDNRWKYKGRPKNYKVIFRLEYLPLIADTTYYARKAYYLLKPIIQNGIITTWELEQKSNWQGWLPWF
jgi:hypothetical protein